MSDQFELMVLPESALKGRRLSKTCGSCEHLARIMLAKTYLKCALMRAHWTGGYGTDVRMRDPACRNWEKAAP